MSTENNPWTLISFSEHKGASWKEKFLENHGITAKVIDVKQFAPEPESACGLVVGVEKLKSFAHEESAMTALREMGIKTARLAIMDVNGMIPGRKGEQPELITTTRGEVSAVEKITQLSRRLIEKSEDGVGRVIFMNILGYGQYANEELKGLGVLLESARMSISGPLLRVMAEPENWAKIVQATEEQSYDLKHRQLLNPLSTGGIDSSVLPLFLPVMADALNIKDGSVKWEDSTGRVWVADELGAPPEMEENMTTHLRGFPNMFIDYLAGLPD